MNKLSEVTMKAEHRIILACKEYLARDQLGRAVYALLTGKTVDDDTIIAQSIKQMSAEKALNMVSELYAIVTTNQAEFPASSEAAIAGLMQCIEYDGVLLIASGASASGKDQIILNCKEYLDRIGISTDIIHKYSTRSKRPGEIAIHESNQVQGVNLDKTAYYTFGATAFEKNSDIFFKYEKYQHQYAFSKNSLRNGKDIDVQFLIFGDISKFSQFIRGIRKYTNRKIISFYLSAEEETLYQRQIARDFLTPREREIRIREMKKDVSLLTNPSLLEMYDLELKNGRYQALGHNEDIVVHEVLKYVRNPLAQQHLDILRKKNHVNDSAG